MNLTRAQSAKLQRRCPFQPTIALVSPDEIPGFWRIQKRPGPVRKYHLSVFLEAWNEEIRRHRSAVFSGFLPGVIGVSPTLSRPKARPTVRTIKICSTSVPQWQQNKTKQKSS